MAATAALEDDEWLYGEGESAQNEKGENEGSEKQMSDDGRDDSNQDETSRVSRFSNDDLSANPGKEEEDRSNSPTPSVDAAKRSSDDKEAGELSGEEENTAAAEKENKENEDGTEDKDHDEEEENAEDGEGGDADTAPPGVAGSDDSDSDDDSVQVTIGDIKAGPPAYAYAGPPVNLNIKRGGAYQPSGVGGQSTGKGKGVDLESVGMINGVPTYEFNLDTMEDKPWRKPGADITDYFNYGFNEDTWKAYCDKQRKLRVEANGNLVGLAAGNKTHHAAKDQQIPIATVNENSKYAGALGKKAGPPPGRKISGSIDVIGASTTTSRRAALTAPKENVIQVVTADKREYSRKPFIDTGMPPPPPGVIPPGLPIFPDLSMPPPGMPPPGMPPPGMPPPGMPPPGMPPGVMPNFGEPFDAYNRSYPPPPGVPLDRPPPGFDGAFEGPYFNGSNSGQDPYNPFEPTADGPWESRDGSGSRYHKKDWDYHGRSSDRSPPRSPTGEEYERRHRDYRERDRDRSRDRDRDRERDRERERSVRSDRGDRDRERHSESRHRDRERDRESRARDYDPEERRERDRSERGESVRRHREHHERDEKHSRSSRRKHREETDESEHRSSRHKRKRSKREKEDESATGGGSSSGAVANEASESQDAPTENQDEDSQPE